MSNRVSNISSYQMRYGVDPKQEYIQSFSALNGGLNIRDPEYALNANESPDMWNLNFKAGVLSARMGTRKTSIDAAISTVRAYTNGKEVLTAFDSLFHGYHVMHIGTKLVCTDEEFSSAIPADNYVVIAQGLPETAGTFFRYGEKLYYKTVGVYLEIFFVAAMNGTPGDGLIIGTLGTPSHLEAASIDKYVPVTAINCDAITGAGDSYQPVNRLTTRQTRKYKLSTAASAESRRHYKIAGLKYDSAWENPVRSVKVSGVQKSNPGDYIVGHDTTNDIYFVQFLADLPAETADNDIEITFDTARALDPDGIMSCRYAEVYGGDTDICVVLGGCKAQGNAYFWSANDDVAMNPGYFPEEHYNFAGDSYDSITGFGKQQNMLVIFKNESVGRASFGTTDINDRTYITMDYVTINPSVGCDVPWSICLCENNLVFANTKRGIMRIYDSSAAYENNILCISDKINGTELRRGVLHDLNSTDRICSYDTDEKYLIYANGNLYEWDYTISTYKNPTWFRHNGIGPAAFWLRSDGKLGFVRPDAHCMSFDSIYTDSDSPFLKSYTFPTMNFGSYDRLKNVKSVEIAVRGDTESEVNMQWNCDYLSRVDGTPFTNAPTLTRDLSYRNLAVRGLISRFFAKTFRRKPGFSHVQHFWMTLYNQSAKDLPIVSVQVFYNYQGRAR